MQYDLQSHQQDRLPRILPCLHGYRQQRTAGYAKSPDSQLVMGKLKLGLYQSGFFHPAPRTKFGLPPVRVLYRLFPSPQKQIETDQVAMKGGGSQEWQWATEKTRSTSAAMPATSRFTFPRQHRPKDLSILQRDIHLIEIKYCEDTRPWNQLSAAQE